MSYSRLKRYALKKKRTKRTLVILFTVLTVGLITKPVSTDSYVKTPGDEKTAGENELSSFGTNVTSSVETAKTVLTEVGSFALEMSHLINAVNLEGTVIPISETSETSETEDLETYYQRMSDLYYAEASSFSGVLANGNTPGPIGIEAAAQMAAATGVPQSTWEYIIARESNGNPNLTNPSSGASGLFQTIPGWGSTATVQDQINSAINAYNSQGLSAWGFL